MTSLMKRIDRLTIGSTVVFTKKPLGSWLSENVPYLVESNSGQTVHFRNAITGSGTFDKASAVEFAEFTIQTIGTTALGVGHGSDDS